MEKIRIIELDLEVEDVSEYNDAAEEILTNFCESLLSDKEMKRGPDDADERELLKSTNGQYFWTDKATNLIEAETSRLYKIGNKYFGETLDLDISTHLYREL